MPLPPGPGLPPLLQTLRMIADPTGFLETCAQRYGDTFTLRVLGTSSPPVVFLSHPDAVQAMFTTLANQFELGKVTDVFRPLTGDQSLIMQDGARHQKQRQLLMPALHGESLHRCGELICQITRQLAWKTGAGESDGPVQAGQVQAGQIQTVQTQMLNISLEVILRVVFGLQPGGRCSVLRELLRTLLERINSPLYSVQFFLPPLQQDWGHRSPWGSFLQLRQQIDDLIYAEIRDRRASAVQSGAVQSGAVQSGVSQFGVTQSGVTQSGDLLAMLLEARDLENQPLSEVELRDQLMTLLLLGHETTASGLTWALYWLYQNPQVLARLQQELDQASDDPQQLAQQPYLTAVCKEALRLYPIALISQPRRVKQPVELEGYRYESGTVLIPCIYLAHRRAAAYPQVEQFCPERFLDNPPSPYEYFPFGGGSRSCIGMALALFEMKLILATLLKQYEFAPAQIQPCLRPARRGITFVPPGEFKLRLLRQRDPALTACRS